MEEADNGKQLNEDQLQKVASRQQVERQLQEVAGS